MHTLKASIVKDLKILLRDRIGLLMMFFMPVLLVIVITSVQNSTFELVNNNKITLLVHNKDGGEEGRRLLSALEKIGMFRLLKLDSAVPDQDISASMHARNAMVAVVIPADFSSSIARRATDIAGRALTDPDSISIKKDIYVDQPDSLLMFYHPVMQPSFRQSIEGALHSAVQVIQGEAIVKKLYQEINSKSIPPDLEKDILFGQIPITEIPVSRTGSRVVPNASQHNVPAWTIFAMFFVVVSLGSSVVREKISGSFIRLKTLPSSYLNALFSKQIVYCPGISRV
jgi:ABC-2 type transport system permease protein